jgi:hypothetical protein
VKEVCVRVDKEKGNFRAREFWWLTGRKYKLERVVERGEEMV